ncbi:MAG TPA: GAF domain-containing sensor histidine kinase [Ktedonobacterales bacterium]|jgi:signal transduction histidine kinase
MATDLRDGQPVARREYDRVMRRAQLREEQVRALIVLQNIANTLSAEEDIGVLLRQVTKAAVRIVSASASALYLLDARGQNLVVEAVENFDGDAPALATSSNPGLAGSNGYHAANGSNPLSGDSQPSAPEHAPLPLGHGIAGQVATSAVALVVNDVAADPRFPSDVVALDAEVLGAHPASIACVPLVFKNRSYGVLEVAQAAAGYGFDARDLDLLQTLAAEAATAIANARLYRSLRDERERMITVQEDVRKELARDLHDGPAQALATIAMRLEFAGKLVQFEPAKAPAELKEIYELALRTTKDIRNLLFDLRPLVLEAEGLAAALRRFLERFASGNGPAMHFDAQYETRLSRNQEAVTFAIAQEAINNVLKHAQAANCWIELRETPEQVTVLVRDDGRGFDTNRIRDQYPTGGSWGLLNMRERAALVEATLKISSQPGRGTAMLLTVPR